MLNIAKLKEYQSKFGGNTISEFIDFIETEQAKNKRAGVVSLESKEAARRLKELAEEQEKNKPISPDEDFKNLR